MKTFSFHHLFFYMALVFAICLAITGYANWYSPIVIYFIAEILGIVFLAVMKGKLYQLPEIAKKAFLETRRRLFK